MPLISQHTGHTVAELHEAYKKLYLPKRLIEVNGKQVYLTGSTSKLTKNEMTEYIMRIGVDAADYGIILPDSREWDVAPTRYGWTKTKK